MPVFVVGYLMAYVFALQLEWLFPVQGYTPIAAGDLAVAVSNLVLPVVTLSGGVRGVDRAGDAGDDAGGAEPGLRAHGARQGA